jgi:hypothetical protein
MRKNRMVIAFLLAVTTGCAVEAGQQPSPATAPELSAEAKVDRVFERWNRGDTPGCVRHLCVVRKDECANVRHP